MGDTDPNGESQRVTCAISQTNRINSQDKSAPAIKQIKKKREVEYDLSNVSGFKHPQGINRNCLYLK